MIFEPEQKKSGPRPKPEPVTPEDLAKRIATVCGWVKAAKNIMVLTGAGASAESGVPTFRTKDGLWNQYNPMEYATPEAFHNDPIKVWKWYDERRQGIVAAQPNPAHKVLARWEAEGKKVFIITQNVDDLHERAGSKQVVHLHGSIWRLRCERDGNIVENREAPLTEMPPYCFCGEIMRPDIVWFGEPLPWRPLQQIDDYLLSGPIDLCLVIGTEASFGYVIELAVHARELGAKLVDINPRLTDLGRMADIQIPGKAGEVLTELANG
jgi:NAD-dependent deacetylase